MEQTYFCWEENNKKHIFEEHLERNLTIEEIESAFVEIAVVTND